MPLGQDASRSHGKRSHDDRNSALGYDCAELEANKGNLMYPDPGGRDGGGEGLSSRPMPIADSLENIYTPWSQIGLTKRPPNAVTEKIASPKVQALRKGKWSEEEEQFTKKLISAFYAGHLLIPFGTTLRTFLSEKLFW